MISRPRLLAMRLSAERVTENKRSNQLDKFEGDITLICEGGEKNQQNLFSYELVAGGWLWEAIGLC
jgi:hypothetical protein